MTACAFHRLKGALKSHKTRSRKVLLKYVRPFWRHLATGRFFICRTLFELCQFWKRTFDLQRMRELHVTWVFVWRVWRGSLLFSLCAPGSPYDLWKWSSLNCASVQNQIRISVHGSAVQSMIHNRLLVARGKSSELYRLSS